MKVKFLVISLVVLLAATAFALPPTGRSTKGTPPSVAGIDNEKYIDVNNILMFVANRGQFARDVSGVFGYDYGTFFPFNGVQYILDGSAISSPLYASGLWIGGIDSATGEKRVKVCEYNTEYRQGPYRQTLTDSLNFYPDAPEFRTFKLYSDSLAGNPNQDYSDWILAARNGAPFEGTDSTIPKMIGNQMLWAVYNDADTANKNDAGSTNSLGIEIRQTTFGFNRQGALNNIIFIKFQVYNKGHRTINNCYFSLWSDPDLGGSADDLVGCDTLLSLGYCYNANNADNQYGSTPPCTGYDFFQGPLVYTGDPADIGKAWGTTWPGYRNLGMVSFNKYINGTDPADYNETYNYMQGLQSDGTPLANGTTYNFPGDPVTGTGELDFDPADRRMMQSTGPVTFRPGDSTEILAAIIFGRGGDRKSSISVMKYYDVTAQAVYDQDFEVLEPPATPRVTVTNLDGVVALRWNDTSEVDPGDYPFQGYTIFQGDGPSDNDTWKQIASFDLIDGESNILDNVLDPNTGVLEYRAVKLALDNGVQRYFGVEEDYLNGGPLHNLTKYYFRIEAYSYDPSGSPRTLTSDTVLQVQPQPTTANTDLPTVFGDSVTVTHSAGISDGSVVVQVVDPTLLTGNQYRVFFDTTGGETTWGLYDITAADTLLKDQTNQSGDEDYPILNGFLIKVLGPEFGVKRIREIATDTGVVAPPLGDNVMYSLNSSSDWYVSSDQTNNFSRLNWRGLIGTYDWEFRFTADSSEYYDWNTDGKWPNKAPFEIWNIGIGTPDDNSDDVRVQFATLDDDASGTWTFGDRMYVIEREYEAPLPDPAVYDFPADFRIGRIIFQDNSGALTAPVIGTVVRFTTAKINTPEDVFTFTTDAPQRFTSGEERLNKINTVPNPFYLFGPYDPAVTNRQILFQHLPEVCTIRIFNLAGELVRTIEKTDAATSIETWDVLTENGLPVASGIYLYIVDAPGLGQKIGKMAVFMEAEVIQKY